MKFVLGIVDAHFMTTLLEDTNGTRWIHLSFWDGTEGGPRGSTCPPWLTRYRHILGLWQGRRSYVSVSQPVRIDCARLQVYLLLPLLEDGAQVCYDVQHIARVGPIWASLTSGPLIGWDSNG